MIIQYLRKSGIYSKIPISKEKILRPINWYIRDTERVCGGVRSYNTYPVSCMMGCQLPAET